MAKFVAGIAGTLLLLTGALWLWQSSASQQNPLPDAPPPPQLSDDAGLPDAGEIVGEGPPPPDAPEAPKASREERRFNRYDRDRDETITRIEMMSSRTKAFRKLDKDGNNLLTFEEWAVATSDRFVGADGDGNGRLTRKEFATTRPKRAAAAKCRC